jgi:chaperone required for assembly of F1-ATPase
VSAKSGPPRRRYTRVRVCRTPERPSPSDACSDGWQGVPQAVDAPRPAANAFLILLDDTPLSTPAKRTLAVPSQALARAIAEEWAAQGERIEPESMPLTVLANSAIDGVAGREAAVRDDIARYAACDLLCYRAGEPETLVRRQSEAWDGILAWAGAALGVQLRVATGLMPLAQPECVRRAIADALGAFDPFGLAAMHVITTLTGSALLALALARGRLTAERTWAAAHVDETYQIDRWGEDVEAQARHHRRWRVMHAASRTLELLAR